MVRGRPHRVTLTVEGTVTRPDYVANRADQKNQGQFEDNILHGKREIAGD